MGLNKSVVYVKKNKKLLNLSAIAERIDMDKSNFHKVVNGTLGMSDDRAHKLDKIVAKLAS